MSGDVPVLQTLALSAGYGKRHVVDNVDLHIHRGEVLCLLGPNGSGKTTLFKTLLGLLTPLGGEVRVQDQSIADWSRNAFARQVGYVPQAHDGMFPFTVEEVVLMGRAARMGRFSTPSPHDRDVVARCLDLMGITTLAQRIYTEISGGERQLALIARALAQEPALLVMDEPCASLDFGNQIRVLEHIARLRGEGMAILLSTHQPDHALRCADQVGLLSQGRIASIGSAASVVTAKNLAALYGVSEAAVAASLFHHTSSISDPAKHSP